MPVLELKCKFIKPALYDEEITENEILKQEIANTVQNEPAEEIEIVNDEQTNIETTVEKNDEQQVALHAEKKEDHFIIPHVEEDEDDDEGKGRAGKDRRQDPRSSQQHRQHVRWPAAMRRHQQGEPREESGHDRACRQGRAPFPCRRHRGPWLRHVRPAPPGAQSPAGQARCAGLPCRQVGSYASTSWCTSPQLRRREVAGN